MKRCFLLFIAVTMILILDTTIFAASTGIHTISSDTAFETGKIFEVRVGLSGNPGIISHRLNVQYDMTVLELINVEDTGLLNNYTAPNSEISSPYTLRWVDPLAVSNNTSNGDIAILTFRAIKATTYSAVGIIHLESRNWDGEKIDFTNSSAIIEVTSPLIVSVVRNNLIEIRNVSDRAISCKGLYLTNDDDLLKWQMPCVIIRQGEAVRVKTENNNVDVVLKRLQTNFNLSVGETISLTDARGNVWALCVVN